MPGQGGHGFSSDMDPARLRREVDAALEAAEIPPADMVWGPTVGNFRFGDMPADRPRDGGGMEWTKRALVLAYFIDHDNTPSTQAAIEAWVEQMTPARVREAVDLAITVGLP